MFKFKPFKINVKCPTANDLWLSLQILKLVCAWQGNLFDDLAIQKYGSPYGLVKSLTERFYPYFWVVLKGNSEFCGFVYFYNIMKENGKNPYSACITACLRRKFWGDEARAAGREFLNFCASIGIKRLKAQCFACNTYAAGLLESLGFKREGVLAQEALAGGRAVDLILYGRLLPVLK